MRNSFLISCFSPALQYPVLPPPTLPSSTVPPPTSPSLFGRFPSFALALAAACIFPPSASDKGMNVCLQKKNKKKKRLPDYVGVSALTRQAHGIPNARDTAVHYESQTWEHVAGIHSSLVECI